MILRGLLGRSFNGFVCVRGFAPLGELIAVSKPNYDYQRELDEQHVAEITEFLDKGENQFFPEIIMAYRLNRQQDGIVLQPNQSILSVEVGAFKIKIKLFPKKYGAHYGGPKTELSIISVNIPVNLAPELFHRIDGNHRLTAAERLNNAQKAVTTPFCLVLLDDNEQKEKIQTTIFHNINTKGQPLTSEQNLNAIFKENRFTDDELSRRFGENYVLSRKISIELDKDYLGNLNQLLKDRPNTCALEIVKFCSVMQLPKEQYLLGEVKRALANINQMYGDEVKLLQSDELGLFTALVYFALTNRGSKQLDSFKYWLMRNNFQQLRNIDAKNIVDIFNQIVSQKRTVFMAMPWDLGVENYNQALQTAVTSIVTQNPALNLVAHPIMQEQSPTHDLIADIKEKIKQCDIFIADITGNNANVLFEYGLAEGQSKDCILIIKKNTEKPKSDYSHNLYHEYEGDYGLEVVLRAQITAVLKKQKFEMHEAVN